MSDVTVSPQAPGWISQTDLNSTYFGGPRSIYDKDDFSSLHTTPVLTNYKFHESIDGGFPHSSVTDYSDPIAGSGSWSFEIYPQEPPSSFVDSFNDPSVTVIPSSAKGVTINNLNVDDSGGHNSGRLTCVVVGISPLTKVSFWYVSEDCIVNWTDGSGIVILEKGWNLYIQNTDTGAGAPGIPSGGVKWIWRPTGGH